MGISARVLLHPESDAGGGDAASSAAQGPPPESSGVEASFSPDLGSVAPSQPGPAPSIGSSTAAPGGPAPQGARPPGDPNATAIQGSRAAANQGATAAQEWQSIRDAASRLGYQGLSQFQDDESAFAHLLQQAQRAQQADAYAQLGRAIAPDLQQYQEFRQSRAQQPAGGEAAPWQPPPFDQKWMGLVDRDPASGMYYAKPGVNPAVAEAVNRRLDWQDRFQQDPISVMDQYAQAQLPKLVQAQVQQALAESRREQSVGQILSANDPWLYQRGADGRHVMGPNGKVPTPEGAAYIQQVRQLQQAGITDPTTQDQIARQLVAGQMAIGRVQQQGGAAPQQQSQAAMGSPNVNPNQARSPLERQQTPGTVEPDGTGLSLSDMMRRAFDQAGYTDQRFEQEMGF